MRAKIALCAWIVAMLTMPVLASGQVMTTVTGTNLLPGGGSLTGTLRIAALQMFTSADGYMVSPNAPTIIYISGQSFSVALIPNSGSSPSPSYYSSVFTLKSSTGQVSWTEYWSVPATGPVDRATIQAYPQLLSPIGVLGTSSGGTGATRNPCRRS